MPKGQLLLKFTEEQKQQFAAATGKNCDFADITKLLDPQELEERIAPWWSISSSTWLVWRGGW